MRRNEPTCEWPADEAMAQLRGDEYFQACQQLRVNDLTDAGGLQAMFAVIWMYECRKAPVSFSAIKKWTVQQANDYFPDPPVEPEAELATKSGVDEIQRPDDGPLVDHDEPAPV